MPQVPFPGAVAGKVKPPKTWRPIEQVTMSYGYGLSVSLIQLARAYTIFARDGELMPLSFVRGDGETSWIMTNTEPLADETGAIEGVVACFVDVTRQTIEVRTEPEDGLYRHVETFGLTQSITPRAFPDVTVAVSAVFEA